MPHCQVSCQQFPVKGRVPLLCLVQLHGEETERLLRHTSPLVKYCSNMFTTGVHLERERLLRVRVSKLSSIQHGRLALLEGLNHVHRPREAARGPSFQNFSERVENESCRFQETSVEIYHA